MRSPVPIEKNLRTRAQSGLHILVKETLAFSPSAWAAPDV